MSDTNGALADEGPLPETEQVLEEMWTGAVQEISRINPRKSNCLSDALVSQPWRPADECAVMRMFFV